MNMDGAVVARMPGLDSCLVYPLLGRAVELRRALTDPSVARRSSSATRACGSTKRS